MLCGVKQEYLSSFFVSVMLVAVLLTGKMAPNYGALTNTRSTPNITALSGTTLFMSPSKVAGITGQTVSINATIEDVTDLFSFQIGLRFNPNILECLSVAEWGFLSNNDADEVLCFPGTIDNMGGVVIPYGWTLTDPNKAKSGNGILANFTFRMKVDGHSDIHVYGFKPLNDADFEISVRTIDIYTPIREWSECSISIVGNAQGSQALGQSGYSAHNLTRSFDHSTVRQLSFNVTGFPINDDPFAFCNVSIPKCLMWTNSRPFFDGWLVLLNDAVHDITATYENATHTSLYFEFNYNASKPTTNVKITPLVDLEHPYSEAELSASTSKWWYSQGESVSVKAKFTTNDVGVQNATVLLKATYPNMSLCLSMFNYTGVDGNASFTFLLDQNIPLGNYTLHLLAGKLGLLGACVTEFFMVCHHQLIDPLPGQYANYRYYWQSSIVNASGWWNVTYTNYVEPNLVNCTYRILFGPVAPYQSLEFWICINTTTRWVPEGTMSTHVNSFYIFWIQTNVSIGSQIAFWNTITTITESRALPLRMTDGTVGYVDCWIIEFTESETMSTFFFDKKTGLCVYCRSSTPDEIAYVELAETNIPIDYNFGDVNRDGIVNGTDVILMQNAWFSTIGDLNYEPNMDFNKDNIINIGDATIIGINWQKHT